MPYVGADAFRRWSWSGWGCDGASSGSHEARRKRGSVTLGMGIPSAAGSNSTGQGGVEVTGNPFQLVLV